MLQRTLMLAISGMMLCSSSLAVEFVQPVKENTPIYSSDGAQIGVLHKSVPVKLLRESNNMLMIKYSDDSVSFVGWALKSKFVACRPPEGPQKDVAAASAEKPAPAAKAGEEDTGEAQNPKTKLTVAQTRKDLRQLLNVPVNYIQQTQIDKKGERGIRTKSTESSKLYVRLNPTNKNADGYAEITVLCQFERDSIVTYFVNEKIAALEDFRFDAANDYYQVIDSYIAALQKYNEDLRGNFITLCNRAQRYERILR